MINCQHLDGLVIRVWDRPDSIFKILTESSPVGLFKFKFHSRINPDSIKLFLDNWKAIRCYYKLMKIMSYEIEKYIVKGTVKKYNYFFRNIKKCVIGNKDFEW